MGRCGFNLHGHRGGDDVVLVWDGFLTASGAVDFAASGWDACGLGLTAMWQGPVGDAARDGGESLVVGAWERLVWVLMNGEGEIE
ncbi:hypothetical protein M0R45_019548 [Rubus argutus]|uniref:Uncharacterized protein n=1 Tax=Rubus argutus TaxID=59490 RepID=A0AAW1X7B7_RUBAR